MDGGRPNADGVAASPAHVVFQKLGASRVRQCGRKAWSVSKKVEAIFKVRPSDASWHCVYYSFPLKTDSFDDYISLIQSTPVMKFSVIPALVLVGAAATAQAQGT